MKNNQKNKIGVIGFVISLLTLILFGVLLILFLSSTTWGEVLLPILLLFWLLGFILSAIGLGKKPIGLAIGGIAISLLIIFIAFNRDVFNTIYRARETVDFEIEKERRYIEVIKKLKDIRKVQEVYSEIKGGYAKDFDDLTKFIETEKFVIISTRDTSWTEFDKTFNIDVLKQNVIKDTLGYISVKDSLFKGDIRYRYLQDLPSFNGELQGKFVMKVGEIIKNNIKFPVFEVYALKEDILKGLDLFKVKEEIYKNSINDVRGDKIKVGSLEEISSNGNWPAYYNETIRN